MRRETFYKVDNMSTMIHLVKYLYDREKEYKICKNIGKPDIDYMKIKHRLELGDRHIHGVMVTSNNRFNDYHYYTYCEKWKKENPEKDRAHKRKWRKVMFMFELN